MMDTTRLLYVDSAATRREAVVEAVAASAAGVEVSVVASAAAAERSMDEQPADAVVARDDLSDADGVSFLRTVAGRHPDAVTVLFDDDPDALVEAARDGAVDACVRDADHDQRRLLAHRVAELCAGGRTGPVGERTGPVGERTDLDALADAATDAFLTIDADSVVRYANPAVEDIFGYAPEEVVGESLTLLMSDELAERHGRGFERYLRTGEKRLDWESVELPGRHADGHEVQLSVSFTEFRTGGERRFAGVVRDVTERKERERTLERHEAMLQTVRDGVYALDDEGRYIGVNQAYADLVGNDPDALVGRKASTVVGEGVRAEADRVQSRLQTDGSDSVGTLETTLTGPDGESVPVEVRISLYPLGEGRYGRVGVVRDVTEHRRREEQLARLNELAQTLTAAETPEAVADAAAVAASEVLDLPYTVVELYDETYGRLEPVARTPAVASLGNVPLFEGDDDVLWQVFAESSGEVFDDLDGASGSSLGSAMVLPIGRYGVFVTGARSADAFGETDVLLAKILTANVRAALERVDRERTLRERKEELESRTTTLERVERINAVIRDLTRALTQASTREEIEQSVCTKLANADPYRFVWIGAPKTVGGELEPSVSAGVEEGYLDAVTVTADDSDTGQGLAGRAVRTREPQVQNDLHADPPFEPWRAEAVRRGYRSSIAVPLVHRDTLYGVLNLYADRPDVFDDLEVGVLRELGEMIGYSINALERKKALVSDRAIELKFEMDEHSVAALGLFPEVDSQFEFDALIERSDGSLRVFFTVAGCDPETVREFVAWETTVGELVHVGEKGEGHLFEATVTEGGFLGSLLERGAHPTELKATSEGCSLTVELPGSGDIRAFLDSFLSAHEGAELVGRRELDRPIRTEEEFRALYVDRLTDRQMEVIKTAYFAGFFDWPRRSTGGEVADLLGVSQPTVNRHIRNGERKLFDIVFDGVEGD